MATAYIPRADAAFNMWQAQFSAILSQNIGFWPVDGNLLSAFFDASDAWTAAYQNHLTAQQAAEAATRAKAGSRERLESAVRPLVKQIQSLLEVTNGDRKNLGITVVQDPARRVGAPKTAPRVQVLPGGRLTHEVRLSDPATPTRKAKPKGVLGAEVWVSVVDQDDPTPRDLASYTFVSLATRASVRTAFQSADKGKLAVYMLRWVNTRGDQGPWSEPTPATVAA